VTGAVNPDTTPILRIALAEGRRDDNAHLVIDLSTVTSLDSVGPYTLLEARHKHHINGGGHLAVVVDANSQVIQALHIVALQATFDLHHKLTEAVHACASAGTDDGGKPKRREGKGAVGEPGC
jgi:anti-anti-sigma regulatory factor